MPGKIVSAPVVNCSSSSSSRARIDAPRDEPGLEQRARLGGEGEPVPRLSHGERLDAERIAREHHTARRAVMDRDRPHAAQTIGKAKPLAAIEVQRRFAVAPCRKGDIRQQIATQLAIGVELAIGDQGRLARLEQRLVAASDVDDREPAMHQRRARRHRLPRPVRTAMRERQIQRGEHLGRRSLAVAKRDAGDAAHQRPTSARKLRQRASTGASA
jgi:hypothetical protein